jgi:hypothetical protein
MAPGCGDSIQGKIVGTWVLDLEATKALPHFQKMPENTREAFFKNLAGMDMMVEFSSTMMTKTWSVQALEGLDRMKQTVTGTYKVNRSKGNTLVLAVTTGEGMKRVGIELRGDQQMIFDMDESKTVLKRRAASP